MNREEQVFEKSFLRKKLLEQREGKSRFLLKELSDNIAYRTEKLLKEKLRISKPNTASGRTENILILGYMAKGNEVDLIRLYKKIWAGDIGGEKSGVDLAFPKINAGGGMDFYIVQSEKDFVKGRFDISEPLIKKGELPVEKSSVDFVVFPGIAFNLQGYRIGYGGGYYDRYFSDYNKKRTEFLGVAYEFQIVNFSPEPHDIRLDMILSEENLYRFKKIQKEISENAR